MNFLKKTVICCAAVAYFAGVYAADYPFNTEILDGGRVEPVNTVMVNSTNEHMNFCFAHRFSDNKIYLYHSKGIHTISERGNTMYSPDNGKTWQQGKNFGGFNAYESLDAQKYQVECWDDNISDEHIIRIKHIDNETDKITVRRVPIKLPFRSTFRLHRDIIRTKSGSLLLNGYLRKEQGNGKLVSFVIESKDDGKTWNYLSTIMEDPKAQYPEGPNESTMVELRNGDILAYVRTGTVLFQFRSKDGGKTWGEQTKVDDRGVCPTAKLLADGTLVLVTGRPGLYMYIDFTGEGKDYQKYTVWGGAGSSYASIMETAPNEVLIVYDESDFGPWRTETRFSRIFASKFKVVRDDSLKFDENIHPLASKYDHFYMATCKQSPEYRNIFFSHGVLGKKVGEKNGTWYEINEIVERPWPVLRLVSKGLIPGHKFSHYFKEGPKNTTTAEAAWEVRIEDFEQKGEQFRVLLRLKDQLGFVYVAVGKDHLFVLDNNRVVKIPYNMGHLFRAFVLKADGNSKTFELYEQESGKLIYKGKLSPNTHGFNNYIQIGDGSNAVFGEVSLSYIGYSFK